MSQTVGSLTHLYNCYALLTFCSVVLLGCGAMHYSSVLFVLLAIAVLHSIACPSFHLAARLSQPENRGLLSELLCACTKDQVATSAKSLDRCDQAQINSDVHGRFLFAFTSST